MGEKIPSLVYGSEQKEVGKRRKCRQFCWQCVFFGGGGRVADGNYTDA